MTKKYRIVAIPGDGIGLEVVEAAITILQQSAELNRFSIAIENGWLGESARAQFGTAFPEETVRRCEGADGILLGAVSSGLLELRKHFDLFANLRPVRPSPSLLNSSPLQAEKLQGVDILFVRELVSGIYFGASGRGIDTQGAYGYHTMRYSDRDIQRIAAVALQQAQRRRQRLSVAHKENALPHLPWTRLVADMAKAFPTVEVEPMLVDNLAMQLVINPQQFDVILAGNLFGDILSDIGGALVGSIGLLGSASLNAEGFGLYEPVHGTAPDIAGKGIANPLGTIAAVALMLQQWGEHTAAHQLIQAQEQFLAQGYRTADLPLHPGETLVNTREVAQLFCHTLNTLPAINLKH